ncbi:alpha/beta hydrolase [uncultured Roseobacter sp.]|uniref:alpha/beta hydrolase n=1 Tax=uncultured Roseobacter sp. TaxID=114847 RepID=UPI0026330B4C|nr:alpha/beta hydrolase [uncultured Roseobacter sp.]
MPLLRINATSDGLQMHGTSTTTDSALGDQQGGAGPIIIMIHGYKYDPNDPTHCPHKKIFNCDTTSWPERLGFSNTPSQVGLGIAFGWYARGALWQAHRRAAKLGRELASLVTRLRKNAPHRPVHVIAHSLGSEIALSALGHLRPHDLGRIVLLTGASFASKAQDMLRAPAGTTTEVFNVTSRENDLFDLAFEHMVAAPELRDRAIGQGIDAPNAINLQLDCDATLRALAQLGLPIAPPARRVCHWSTYTRPGVMALYARLLRDPESLPQAYLADILPGHAAPRWSRFKVPLPRPTYSLGPAITLPVTPLALKLKNRIMTATSAQRKDNEHAY